jgi:hypothetical protein
MNAHEKDLTDLPRALARFFLAPFRLRTYANLLYLALAFPLGLVYFVFLIPGLALGAGLTIVWVGLLVLALVFAGSWGLAALERLLAIHLLGAEVPPMLPPVRTEPASLWQTVKGFLANPVTWKGMAFLLAKLPLGVVTFVLLVTSLSVSGAFLAVPVVFPFAEGWWSGDPAIRMDGLVWTVDTVFEALLCGAFGAVLFLISLNLLNGLAFLWRETAVLMLGSPRFATPPPSALPEPAVAV